MGTATVRQLDRSEIEAEKKAILAQLGMSEDALRRRADDYLLTEEESAAWRRFEALTWLSGE